MRSFEENDLRLSPREWLIAGAVLFGIFWFVPAAWERVEPVEFGPDYRIPYRLGDDYALYARWCRHAAGDAEATVVLGDSTVWGHYVAADQTLPHYLSAQSGRPFVDLGLDGVHPAALAGLVEYYGGAVRQRRVIVSCNPLWMSTPRHDLTDDKEFALNHPRLVPQLTPRIPCYRESLEGRLGIVVGRRVPLLGWAGHIRMAYFANSDLWDWLREHPRDNPLSAVTRELPSPQPIPEPDTAKPWQSAGIQPINPPWVELDSSLQWTSFQATMAQLQARGNRVFVVVGPFNEHMLKPESLAKYREVQRGIAEWLTEQGVAHCVPQTLPSPLWADASHPLGEGYAELARRLLQDEGFLAFCQSD